MNILLLLFFVAALIGICFVKDGYWNTDYLRIGNTRAISGVFVMMVFLAHASSYLNLEPGEKAYFYFRAAFSQLIVTPFYLYSGYGIYRSIAERGNSYVRTMPYKRFFRVWYHFALAVCMYWLLLKIYGYRINPPKIPLVFVGWYSIGNSNWFIFDILVFYCLSWISFAVFGKKRTAAVWCNVLLCVLFGLALYWFRPELRTFYNVILAYPMGVLVGHYQKGIETFVRKSGKRYGIVLGASVLLFLILEAFRRHLMVYEIHVVVFLWILLLLSMKIKVGNSFLDFLGAHIFEIYIYQRIPMIVLSQYGIVQHHALFGIVCFILTVLLAVGMKYVEDRLDEMLRIRKKAA